MKLRAQILALSLTISLSLMARADDWPQWMGPRRDNVWRESGLIETFPDGGPKVLWRAPVAGGYAGPAVADGRVYVTDYSTESEFKPNFERDAQTGVERVHCLDASTGKTIWKHEYPVEYSISYPAGPRCTPTVAGGKVYTLGAQGRLLAFDARTGRLLWSHELTEEYATKPALWGYTNHPLVDGNKLVSVVGGKGSHVVAFDKDSGRELWRTITSKEQGYCPPMILEAGGARQLVLLRADGISGVNPKDGAIYWTLPYDATSGSIIMTPVRYGKYLFAAGYSNKNLLIELASERPAAKEVWRDLKGKALSPVNTQPILKDDVLYGFDQGGTMYAVRLPGGERLWESTEPVGGGRAKRVATAFIVREKSESRDRFWLLNESGELIIANLTPAGYEEKDRARILEPTGVAMGRRVLWSAPAFANRHIYARSDREIVCVDLSAPR